MNEPLVCWIVMAFFLGWRPFTMMYRAQKWFQKLGVWFQWYSLTMVSLVLLVARTFYDFVRFEVIGFKCLAEDKIKQNLDSVPLTPDDQAKLRIFPWLKWLALFGPLVGVLALGFLCYHVYQYALSIKKIREQDEQEAIKSNRATLICKGRKARARGRVGVVVDVDDCPYDLPVKIRWDDGQTPHADWCREEEVEIIYESINAWRITEREDLNLLVIVMPGIFILMAMRAEIRVLEVMTASWWRTRPLDGPSWEQGSELLMNTYTADLEVASAFQYVTVWGFAQLVMAFFSLEQLSKNVNSELTVLKRERSKLKAANQHLLNAWPPDVPLPHHLTTQGGKAQSLLIERVVDQPPPEPQPTATFAWTDNNKSFFSKVLATFSKTNSSSWERGRGSLAATFAEKGIEDEVVRASQEHTSSMKWAGLQGVWAYILIGVVRSVCDIVATLLDVLPYHELSMKWQALVLDRVSAVFGFVTLLCVYNMTIILRMEDIRKSTAMGRNAVQKFIALRFLLLLGQLQPSALTFLSKSVTHWNFSDYQAKLLHATLLNYECLGIIILNIVLWRPRDPIAAPAGYIGIQ